MTQSTPADFLYVERDAELAAVCREFAEAGRLAIDTEFLREKTYFPQLCLIQIASTHRIACIDPLALTDLAPLARLLAEPRIVKIFHAARQDVEVLYRQFEIMPRPLFDTQLAAALSGYGEQIGYAALVERITGVHLAKAHTRTDWSRRPVARGALAYAADDVRYLGALHDHLRRRLHDDKRLDWLEKDAEMLTDPAVYLPDPDASFMRVRGQNRLEDPAARGVLKTLSAWRERRAIDRNRPRQWILADSALMALARRAPRSLAELEEIEGTGGLLKAGLGEQVLGEIAAGQNAPAPPAAVQKPTPGEREIINRLAATLRERAAALGVSAALLANRRQLERLAQGARDVPVLRGWRRTAVGAELLEQIETRQDSKLPLPATGRGLG